MGEFYIKDFWIAVQKPDGTFGDPVRWSGLKRINFAYEDWDDDWEFEDYD